MIGADVLDKLRGVLLDHRDRELIYVSLAVNGLVTLLLIGAIVALILVGKNKDDVAVVKDIVANLIWAEFALVVVFVAGSAERRNKAAKTLADKPA